jgi:hypothetical protein
MQRNPGLRMCNKIAAKKIGGTKHALSSSERQHGFNPQSALNMFRCMIETDVTLKDWRPEGLMARTCEPAPMKTSTTKFGLRAHDVVPKLVHKVFPEQ